MDDRNIRIKMVKRISTQRLLPESKVLKQEFQVGFYGFDKIVIYRFRNVVAEQV